MQQPDEKPMRFISIKWKLSLAFIMLTIGIVAIYIVIAKNTFESDKVSYVFETQQRQVNQSAMDLKVQIQRLVFDARSILAGYDFNTHQLAPMSEKLFKHHEILTGIQLINKNTSNIMAQVEKSRGQFAKIGPQSARGPAASGGVDLRHLGGTEFLAQVPDVTSAGEALILKVLFQLPSIFSESIDDQALMLTAGSEILVSTEKSGIAQETVTEFLRNRKGDVSELTEVAQLGGARYLISTASIGVGGMSILSFVSEDAALTATRTLYQRSLMFLFFSFFATVVISMTLSSSLTQNLFDLSKVAERFGKGDFSVSPSFESRDEIGLLARAFKRMMFEIQQLLTDRVEKVRMEQELKTARTVQDSLFPAESNFEAGNLKLTGLYSTTTECGGDWWYYYQKDRYLYLVIADATGHGTPAALITAAIRSAFSHIELNDLSLMDIASACDEAVFQCSKGHIYMTAIFMRINVNTGEGTFINSSHEPPWIFEWDLEKSKIKSEQIVVKPDPRLGERAKKWVEHPIQVQSGQRLFLYTDGLSSPVNPEGNDFQGRRQKRAVEKAAGNFDRQKFFDEVIAAMNEHSQGAPFPDDVTFIVIDHHFHVG